MPPRPAPDLDLRRALTLRAAREAAEADGWAAVTMRGLAARLGVTQPAIYAAFDGRQAIIDAIALEGFDDLADALEGADATPPARAEAYLGFAAANPQVYDAMFALPSRLVFGAEESPSALRRAFDAIRAVLPDTDETLAEVAWAALHGLATLQAAGRLRSTHTRDRLDTIGRLFDPEDHA